MAPFQGRRDRKREGETVSRRGEYLPFSRSDVFFQEEMRGPSELEEQPRIFVTGDGSQTEDEGEGRILLSAANFFSLP